MGFEFRNLIPPFTLPDANSHFYCATGLLGHCFIFYHILHYSYILFEIIVQFNYFFLCGEGGEQIS